MTAWTKTSNGSLQPTQGQKRTLTSLPAEIHLEIIDHLAYPARLALAYTSSYFRQLVTRQSPSTKEEKLDFLCLAETWSVYINIGYLACRQCLKFRPDHAFADRQLRGKRSRGYSENNRRFCLRCGIQSHIYQPGNLIPIGKDNANTRRGRSDGGFVICWCCKFQGSGCAYTMVFGSCDHCGRVSPPALHYIWGQAYQPCVQHFHCHCCGQEGRLSRLRQPLRGRIDDILRQYRVHLAINDYELS